MHGLLATSSLREQLDPRKSYNAFISSKREVKLKTNVFSKNQSRPSYVENSSHS